MRIAPTHDIFARSRPARLGRRGLTEDSRLGLMILRMISLNSLAAFTQDVSRVTGNSPVTQARATGAGTSTTQPAPTQRTLEAAPSTPFTGQSAPRGSLLDLRV